MSWNFALASAWMNNEQARKRKLQERAQLLANDKAQKEIEAAKTAFTTAETEAKAEDELYRKASRHFKGDKKVLETNSAFWDSLLETEYQEKFAGKNDSPLVSASLDKETRDRMLENIRRQYATQTKDGWVINRKYKSAEERLALHQKQLEAIKHNSAINAEDYDKSSLFSVLNDSIESLMTTVGMEKKQDAEERPRAKLRLASTPDFRSTEDVRSVSEALPMIEGGASNVKLTAQPNLVNSKTGNAVQSGSDGYFYEAGERVTAVHRDAYAKGLEEDALTVDSIIKDAKDVNNNPITVYMTKQGLAVDGPDGKLKRISSTDVTFGDAEGVSYELESSLKEKDTNNPVFRHTVNNGLYVYDPSTEDKYRLISGRPVYKNMDNVEMFDPASHDRIKKLNEEISNAEGNLGESQRVLSIASRIKKYLSPDYNSPITSFINTASVNITEEALAIFGTEKANELYQRLISAEAQDLSDDEKLESRRAVLKSELESLTSEISAIAKQEGSGISDSLVKFVNDTNKVSAVMKNITAKKGRLELSYLLLRELKDNGGRISATEQQRILEVIETGNVAQQAATLDSIVSQSKNNVMSNIKKIGRAFYEQSVIEQYKGKYNRLKAEASFNPEPLLDEETGNYFFMSKEGEKGAYSNVSYIVVSPKGYVVDTVFKNKEGKQEQQRPLSNVSTEELEAGLETYKDNPTALKSIEDELAFRKGGNQ